MEIISLCLEQLRAQGSDQWDEIYPSLKVVEGDAQAGTLFVARAEGQCVGSVCLNDVQPEVYAPLPWSFTKGRALVIHRLCAHPEWQRSGVGKALMEFTEDFARTQGFGCIRLDAYTGNPRATALYERRGYQRVGQVYFPRRKLPFDCFELEIG